MATTYRPIIISCPAVVSVSVCIPTHNRAQDLAVRLEELRAQTLGSLEVVVLDDGSTDHTAEVVRAAAASDPRVRCVPMVPAVGMPAIIERCFEEARADVVAMFHDHDSYCPRAVEVLARALESEPTAPYAFSGISVVDPDDGSFVARLVDEGKAGRRNDVPRHFVASGRSLVGASAVIVRRARVPAAPITRELGLFADVELWVRMALEDEPVYVSEALVEIQGWGQGESLVKLNWQKVGSLGRLRASFVNAVATGSADAARLRVGVRLSTVRMQLTWLLRLLRYAWRGGDPGPALIGAPRVVAWLVRRVASAGARAAAR